MSLEDVMLRARRIALMGAMIETYQEDEDRLGIVIGFYDRGILSRDAVEMLIEAYGLPAAEYNKE